MISVYKKGAYLLKGMEIVSEEDTEKVNSLKLNLKKYEAKKGTITYSILSNHNISDNMDRLKIKFDAMASHDITFVGIIQTAKASGMRKFPIPYVLTNCHNSLCAVGGTINEDDHMFGLSAAKKYGGIYVPPHISVIHQYMREMMAGCGKMILGSDSHTRYGALGTMAIGEGGGELVKQLLCSTYDISYPEVVGVYLTGKPQKGVGPQDIALAIIGKVFKSGYVKNKVMEFVGPGISNLSVDFRNGIDVMTTETTCLTSIWRTDEEVRMYLKVHNREEDYAELNPDEVAYYDGMIYVDLSIIKPMIALPFHPSNVYEIDYLNNNLKTVLKEIEEEANKLFDNQEIEFNLKDKIVDGKLRVDQGIIAGCAGGTYSNIMEASKIIKNKSCGNGEFSLSIYPSSQPIMSELIKSGAAIELINSGVIIKTAFCGPCFGAGDTPANGSFSIRHTTRNFPNREGSKPGNNQLSYVALMDARSIASTAANGRILTPATDFDIDYLDNYSYEFNQISYLNRVYDGYSKPNKEAKLVYGPNIKDWPKMSKLTDNILLKVCSKIMDEVTTTDELIPSGETSAFRSNPLGLAEFTLSRRDERYVPRAKEIYEVEKYRINGGNPIEKDFDLAEAYKKIKSIDNFSNINIEDIEIGSVIYCNKPGDGSAREQAASCQRVIGGLANICKEYATKRYRSNVINWGMIPFQTNEEPEFNIGDYIFVPNIRQLLDKDMENIKAYVIGNEVKEINLYISNMTYEEREIIKAGSLINYNRSRNLDTVKAQHI
ncbi:hydratase [Romboutsia sp. Marseille-P6047]|uniref:hydratase n=1 Tax=Romboutsia sp. Marseille-P6047 TaxID=2161817 RepID=UPI000F0659CC|nr:hydratase [Romboutsia sp. Marseille-P6047]